MKTWSLELAALATTAVACGLGPMRPARLRLGSAVAITGLSNTLLPPATHA